MSTTYKTIEGDTFETISRRVYGTDSEADVLRAANPGSADPFRGGISLVVPIKPDGPAFRAFATGAEEPEEISITIDDKKFVHFEKLKVTRAIDSFDTISFDAPFEPEKEEFRSTFRPFSFKPVVVTIGGNRLFVGTMVPVDPSTAPQRRAISVGCYALPGVLNDCTLPASAFPLEFNGQNLKEVATAILRPFGLSLEFVGNPGAAFERVACEPDKKALEFLTDLAQQRGFVISNTSTGKVRIWKSNKTGVPVARLREGASPVTSVTPNFSPQSFYSHITGIESIAVGGEGSQFTVKNPHLPKSIRPFTFKLSDTDTGNTPAAVQAKAGRMFGALASYTVNLNTWHDANGDLWEPNTTVTLYAPGAMVYSEYSFIIRSVELTEEKSRTASLVLCMPGAFNGEIPKSFPWD